MTLLRDIQEAAIDANISISVVLRKCKVLATRLGNEDLNKWVDSELNGYNQKEDLPSYRVLVVYSKGHFQGPFGSGLRYADIPTRCLPEKFQDSYSHSYCMRPISEYEALIPSSDGEPLREPWSPNFVAYIGGDVYQGMHCVSAWKVIPHSVIVGLVDVVRNKILSFVLEIEKEAPDVGEETSTSSSIPPERVAQVFHMYIYGDVQSIAAQSSSFIQIGELNIQEGDFDSLADYLKTHEVSDEDIATLKEEIERDLVDNPGPTEIGTRVNAWISRMVNNAIRGTWQVSVSVAASMLTQAICSYYGWFGNPPVSG